MVFDIPMIRKHLEIGAPIPFPMIEGLCNEIDRFRAEAKPTPQQEGKTVKVRVAVAVDKTGDWLAMGSDGFERQDVVSRLASVNFPGGDAAIYWLTATLPVPEEREVVATVEVENG